MTIVEGASTIAERSSPLKSIDTSGSSLTPRMPFIGPLGGGPEGGVDLVRRGRLSSWR
jgi:hypothetical protein